MVDFGDMTDYYNRLTKNDSQAKFPNCVIEERVLSGIIEWNDNPTQWAGPWRGDDGKKYVVFAVKDHRFKEIHDEETAISSYKKYLTYSAHNLPTKIRSQLSDFAKDGYRTVNYSINEEQCSSSTLTYDELNFCKSIMTKEQLSSWERKIQDQLQKYIDYEMKACPTVEFPYVISLYGTDDTSYGVSVPNFEIAKQVLQSLTETPTWANLYRLGFVFTN